MFLTPSPCEHFFVGPLRSGGLLHPSYGNYIQRNYLWDIAPLSLPHLPSFPPLPSGEAAAIRITVSLQLVGAFSPGFGVWHTLL